MEGKLKLLFLLLLLALTGTEGALAESLLVGRWAYFMKIYDEQEMPEPPGATLRLRYEFSEAGISRLYWWHEGESDLCERRGHYRLELGILVDEVTWINPANSYGCSRDPDMQNGKITRTPISFENGNMLMRLQFGEEEIFYVWKKMKEGEL
ncbi:MAG: hypothetical protein AB7K68_13345 [Bacteriovoracia bacterium]